MALPENGKFSPTPVAESTAQRDEHIAIVPVARWTAKDVKKWAEGDVRCSKFITDILAREQLDGEVLLAITEEDVRNFRTIFYNNNFTFVDMKKFWIAVQELKEQDRRCNIACHAQQAALAEILPHNQHFNTYSQSTQLPGACRCHPNHITRSAADSSADCDYVSPPISEDGRATNIPPEFFKTAISLGYSFLVTWITSFVMVIVHERVPDMKRYPPLPDIFLDNVPHIPWAFHMCELTGTLLFLIWACVCIFHKYRTVLLRRFFALAGTVFLLRCVTMLITSLSVPGTHLQCNQNDYAVDDTELNVVEALEIRITRAYTIWSGLGMSIQGVRTCGDYMFSGHTVALTLLNFFITEYTPRNLYFLHTLTWLLNMFGIFFILAAHEHYSIDVFVAFYITSRLFLYYHTLANNQALMSRDSTRTRIWFPMFSYFESSVNGIIPNEYDTIGTLLDNLFQFLVDIKDSFMLTARRFWIEQPQSGISTKSMHFVPTLSTNASVYNTPTSQSSAASFSNANNAQQHDIKKRLRIDGDNLATSSLSTSNVAVTTAKNVTTELGTIGKKDA